MIFARADLRAEIRAILAIKIVTSARDQNTDLMNFTFTKNIGMLLLAIYLIVIGAPRSSRAVSVIDISPQRTGPRALPMKNCSFLYA
jgi:hypothetical protein